MNDLASEIARERERHSSTSDGRARVAGYERIYRFPEGEAIVSMVQFNGHALVATNQHIYEIKDGKLVRILLQEVEPEERA